MIVSITLMRAMIPMIMSTIMMMMISIVMEGETKRIIPYYVCLEGFLVKLWNVSGWIEGWEPMDKHRSNNTNRVSQKFGQSSAYLTAEERERDGILIRNFPLSNPPCCSHDQPQKTSPHRLPPRAPNQSNHVHGQKPGHDPWEIFCAWTQTHSCRAKGDRNSSHGFSSLPWRQRPWRSGDRRRAWCRVFVCNGSAKCGNLWGVWREDGRCGSCSRASSSSREGGAFPSAGHRGGTPARAGTASRGPTCASERKMFKRSD